MSAKTNNTTPSWISTVTFGLWGGSTSPVTAAQSHKVKQLVDDHQFAVGLVAGAVAGFAVNKIANSSAVQEGYLSALTKVSEWHPKLACLKPAVPEKQPVFTVYKGWTGTYCTQVGTLEGKNLQPTSKS